MNNPRLLTTLRGRTGAPLHGRNDCSAYARQLYHQNMQGPSTFVCAYNDGVAPVTPNPLAEAQASISRAARILPLLSYRIPFNESTLDLGCCLV
ncbi:hypothetical protein DM02DRAFT_620928 [Periconia macrospinosa]|uniref:Uncharacterized protein n=1 Tax=Periconia macrospinosa TaxID=97972 RepID=A0A2V1CZ75_9PLEO|nr:hypothetical protein DM02DRAFT_620928 [Periconia macrospinosa]